MGTSTDKSVKLYGLVADFGSPEAVLAGAEKVRAAGFSHTDAFTPFPVHGLAEALGMRRSRMAGVMMTAGIVGACLGLLLQWWVSSIAYPHVVSGRPLFSWPNFIPIVFECMVLVAAVTGFIVLLVRCGLPRPYHPVFSAPGIEKATTDGFFILVKSTDPRFDLAAAGRALRDAGGKSVIEVPWEEPGEDG